MIFWSEESIKRMIDGQQTMVTEFARSYSEEISKLRERVAHLEQTQPSVLSVDTVSRIEALELWRGKVHGMLIEQTPTGKEKASSLGKRIREFYKH